MSSSHSFVTLTKTFQFPGPTALVAKKGQCQNHDELEWTRWNSALGLVSVSLEIEQSFGVMRWCDAHQLAEEWSESRGAIHHISFLFFTRPFAIPSFFCVGVMARWNLWKFFQRVVRAFTSWKLIEMHASCAIRVTALCTACAYNLCAHCMERAISMRSARRRQSCLRDRVILPIARFEQRLCSFHGKRGTFLSSWCSLADSRWLRVVATTLLESNCTEIEWDTEWNSGKPTRISSCQNPMGENSKNVSLIFHPFRFSFGDASDRRWVVGCSADRGGTRDLELRPGRLWESIKNREISLMWPPWSNEKLSRVLSRSRSSRAELRTGEDCARTQNHPIGWWIRWGQYAPARSTSRELQLDSNVVR